MRLFWLLDRRSVGAAGFVACAFLAQPGRADEPVGSFRLAWVRGEGADGCVDERELVRRVRGRLGRNPFSDEAAQSIEGDISTRAGKFHVELRVRDATGTLAGRRELDVTAPDCKQLTDAVVLAIALVIDPRAPLVDPPAASASSPDGPRAAPEPDEPGSGPPAAPSAPDASPTPPEPSARPQAPERACPPCAVSEGVPASSLSARASVRAVGAAGLLPNLAPGLGVGAGIGVPRLRFTAGMSYFPEQDTGVFAFGLSTAELGVCASAPPLGTLTPSLCAQFQAGAMHAVVRELEPLRTGDHLWAALGLGPELSWKPLGPLLVEASVLGVVPVVRPRFAVRGERGTVFESRRLGALGILGVGVGLP